MSTPWQTAKSPRHPPFGTVALVGRTCRLFLASFARLVPLAFVPVLLVALAGWGMSAPLPEDFDPEEGQRLLSWGEILLSFANLLLSVLLTGFFCLAAVDLVIGRSHWIREYLRQTLRHLLPLTLFAVLLTLMVIVGSMALLLPGLYLAARFLPWVAVVVFEDAGWSALGRTQRLTAGYRWPLLGAMMVMGLIMAALGALLLGLPLAAGLSRQSLPFAFCIAAFYAILYPLDAIFTALVYVRLRGLRDGVTVDQIARALG